MLCLLSVHCTNEEKTVDGRSSEVGCSIQYENPNKNEIEIITAIERELVKKTYRSILSRHIYIYNEKKHESLFSSAIRPLFGINRACFEMHAHT